MHTKVLLYVAIVFYSIQFTPIFSTQLLAAKPTEQCQNLEWEANLVLSQDSKMKEVYRLIHVASNRINLPVLITGEVGTGKEKIARMIHNTSQTSNKHHFLMVHCAAIPKDRIDSVLFGGPTDTTYGIFQNANGGTVFLDEIDTLPLSLQVKLLRLLQEGRVRPVESFNEHVMGVDNTQHPMVNVRVIAATSKDLRDLIKEGKFREDLYQELNAINIHVPPLRNRPGDIKAFAIYFLRKYLDLFYPLDGTQTRRRNPSFTSAAIQKLRADPWEYANIIELENVIRRAVILSRGEKTEFDAQDIFGPDVPNIKFPE